MPLILIKYVTFCFFSLSFSLQTTMPVYIQCNEETILDTTWFTLNAEGEEIAQSDSFFGALAMYFSSFFVFNLPYPRLLQHSLTFVQKIILSIQDELPPTKPIITLTNKLNVLNDQHSKHVDQGSSSVYRTRRARTKLEG